MTIPPTWRLPEGVNASLWSYATSPRIAREEDAYFEGHPLFRADAAMLDARLVEPGPLADLGCGAGRLSLHFARRGFPVTAVELSQPLLEVVGLKAAEQGVRVSRLRANLCDLRCLPDSSFAYALMMFSTLGMIRGSAQRQRALSEAARILRPGGTLALHAHNIYLNLHDPQGRRWLIGQLAEVFSHRSELGDRLMTYRGIPGMEVHLYRWRELKRSLAVAGLRIFDVIPIDAIRASQIPAPWFWHGLRAGGWIVFAKRL
jgi:SAM-dependent methyltransferase